MNDMNDEGMVGEGWGRVTGISDEQMLSLSATVTNKKTTQEEKR